MTSCGGYPLPYAPLVEYDNFGTEEQSITRKLKYKQSPVKVQTRSESHSILRLMSLPSGQYTLTSELGPLIGRRFAEDKSLNPKAIVTDSPDRDDPNVKVSIYHFTSVLYGSERCAFRRVVEFSRVGWG